jgi:hypothetical protein
MYKIPEDEIRTHDTSKYTNLANQRFKPLSHLKLIK